MGCIKMTNLTVYIVVLSKTATNKLLINVFITIDLNSECTDSNYSNYVFELEDQASNCSSVSLPVIISLCIELNYCIFRIRCGQF